MIDDSSNRFLQCDPAELIVKGPDSSQSLADVPSRRGRHRRLWVQFMPLAGSTGIVQTCRVVWERSRIGIRIEFFQNSSFRHGLGGWKTFDVKVSNLFLVHMYYHGH